MTGRAAPVRGRSLFSTLAHSRQRSRSGPVRVHFAPTTGEECAVCVAFSVSRKVGGAVVRNRCRRRLRAITSEISAELPVGAYLVTVSPEIHSLSFDELRDRVVDTMRRASEQNR